MIRLASTCPLSREFVMPSPNNEWPSFTYHAGQPPHLHALGVISSCYNSFERILFDLYLHHLDHKKFPRSLTEKFFLSLAERDRLGALRDVFTALEKNKRVV